MPGKALHWQGNIDRADRAFIGAWLAAIPPEGVRDTVPAFWESLCWFSYIRQKQFKRFALPKPAGLSRWFQYHARWLEANGWRFTFGRNSKGRWLSIAPIGTA